jgi:hypothetical protein
LIVETPSLPMAIENGGTSLPTPEMPCRTEIVPILVNWWTTLPPPIKTRS